MSLPFLESIGLTRKETDLYELLLRLGETPAGEIIRQSKLKRATVYKVLYGLETKGLVTKRDIGKIIHFRPAPPTRLTELAEARHHELDRARQDLSHLVPQLTSSYILSVEKPVVSTFEGVEGLKQIYEDTLREAKTIYATHQLEDIDPTLFDWLKRSYVPRRVKLGIHAYVIVASGRGAEKYVKRNKIANRTTITVPRSQFPFQHEVNIYGDKIAFINARKETNLLGIIIEHPHTAKTMKSWFDLAWKGAESLQQNAQAAGAASASAK